MHLFQARSFIAFFNISIFFLLVTSISASAQQPAINSFTPTTVCQGGVITIKGANFTNASAVTAGSLAASKFSVIDDNTITATVASTAADGPVTVTTDVGMASSGTLTVKPAPRPDLTDMSTSDPFTNCDGNASYLLIVRNSSSSVTGTGNNYTIDWGDNSPKFSQMDWPIGAQVNHQYTAQGYFAITITIAPGNGCTRNKTIQFYNGTNPLGSFTTSESTTGLCAPAAIQFQIGNWFNNSAGTVYQIDFGDGTPKLSLTHPLNASSTVQLLSHTYSKTSCPNTDFTATLEAVNGCYTTRYTLNQIIIRIKPQADFTVPASPGCVNVPVCFANTSTNGYSGNSCSTTSNYLWDFGDNATYTGPTPPCHQYASPGTYTVTLSAGNSTCGNSSKTRQVTVLPVSPPPTVNAGPVMYCQGQVAMPLTATGVGLLWYASAAGGIGSPTAPTPSTVTTGTMTYYVSQTLANDCESQRVPVTVTVNALPGAPVVYSPVQLCLGATAAPLTATGSGLLWYANATGGAGSSTAPVPSTAAVGTTTYYVSQTTNACEGPRAAVVVNVIGPPTAPIAVSPVTYCQYQAVGPLSATGTGLLWYTVAAGGIGSPVAPVPSTNTPGTTTYYVSQGSGCGESPRTPIIVNVNAAPAATISYPATTLCNVVASPTNPNPPIAVTQTGDAGGSYSIVPATGLSINSTTGEINPSGAAPGTYTVRYSVNGAVGCGVFTATTTVTINAAPSATIGYPDLCTSDAVTIVTFTGSAGGTYSSTTGLSINAASGSINPSLSQPGTYTVIYTITPSAPCPGFATTANVTITRAPSATIHYPITTLCNVSASPATPNPPIAVIQMGDGGGNYTISPATGLSIDPSTGEINPSGATPGTYTIQYRVAGSGACKNFATTTNVTVAAAPTATISYPDLCTSDAVTTVRLTGGGGGTYSSTTGLNLDGNTGSINPSLSQPGSYTVIYTIPPSAPCPGFLTTTNVTITRAPSAAIHYPAASFCNVTASPATPNPPVPVIRTGDAGGSYTISPATGLSINASTGELNPSGATPGTYTIEYRVAGSGACKDFSTTTTVNINAAPIAIIQYIGAPYCRATNALQPVSLSGAAVGIFTSDLGLSLNATTGSINPSLSQPGTYSVTYTIAASPPCPGYITSTTVEIVDYPTLNFARPIQSICSGGTALYTPSSNIASATYQWSVVGPLPTDVSGVSSGTSLGLSPISLTFTNTSASPVILTIRVVPANPTQTPCQGPPYDLTLTVNPITPAPTPNTFNFCMGDAATSLSVQPLPGTVIKWYDVNGNTLPTAPVISTPVPARYSYYVTQTNNTGCESPKTPILAIVNPTPKIVGSSYSNPSVCGVPSGSIVLTVADLNDNPVPNLPMTVHYTKFQLPYTADVSTDASGYLTIPLTAGTYSNIYVDASGCTSQKIPDVFILKDPSPPSPPAVGYNGPLCSEYPLTLTALSAASPVPGPLEYVWAGPAFGPVADTVNSSVITFPSADMSVAGTYIVYAIQNNCISATSSLSVLIRQSPSKPSIVTQNPLCVGDNLQLQAFSTIPSGDKNLEYAWKGPGTGFPVNGPVAEINKVRLEDGGVYSITVTSPETGCSTTTDTLIRIGGYPILEFAQDTLTVPTGLILNAAPTIVNAADPGILPMAKFVWTPAKDVGCNDSVCGSPVINIKDNACYNVTGTNSYGCSGSAAICVKVFCKSSQVFIPNAFAPRGNIGANKILMVRATGISSVRSFRIYNRWGKIVFERSNFPPNSPDFGWDGTVNGRLADSGVYVYTAEVLCENGVPYTFKGNVTLF